MAAVGENAKVAETVEKKNLESLRMAVNREDPDAKFLRWRREFVPKGSISDSEILNEIAMEKMFGQGFDKKGRPISVVIGARHTCFNRDIDEFKHCQAGRKSLW
ncbi:hypothetical protein EJ110_NYTH30927 [Nymphaea thermarum]|nr:hypothetical protein EJ110_NYTH30927 [Nymphaea thermarum]